MRVGNILLGACLVMVCGCEPTQPQEEIPYHPATDMKQLMNWVLDPAADVIWGAAGSVSTVEGTQDLAPTTDEGWAAVRHSAAVVAECGNLLMMPRRARDSADWIEISRGLIDIGTRAIEAAEARDADALFAAGGDLYNVCTACHQRYMLPAEESPPTS